MVLITEVKIYMSAALDGFVLWPYVGPLLYFSSKIIIMFIQ